jgi:hypothetical protein
MKVKTAKIVFRIRGNVIFNWLPYSSLEELMQRVELATRDTMRHYDTQEMHGIEIVFNATAGL